MSGKTANFKTKSSCVRQKRFLIMNLNPKVPGGNGGGGSNLPAPSCGFSKNVSSKDRVEPWLFVTFNIILKHIFPENFIEFLQIVQKI